MVIILLPLLSVIVTLTKVSGIKVTSGSMVVTLTLKNSSGSVILSSVIGTLPQALEVLSSKVKIADVAE